MKLGINLQGYKGLEKHIMLTSVLFSRKLLIFKKELFGISVEENYTHFAVSFYILF